MYPRQHKVFLVVDRTFGGRLVLLAKQGHVWAVASPENTAAMQMVWGSTQATADNGPMGSGVTSFCSEEPTIERMCEQLADEIDIHHGEGTQDPPWSEIEVVGTPLTDTLREAFSAIGGHSFVSTKEGFLCRRDAD
jgi:hypothetical protein